MPHFVIDCSENILKVKSPEEIMQNEHDSAESAQLFDIGVVCRTLTEKQCTQMLEMLCL